MATKFAIVSIDYQGNAVFQNGTNNVDPINVWLERGGVLVQGSWDEVDGNAKAWTYPGVQSGDVPWAQRLNAASPVRGPVVPAAPVGPVEQPQRFFAPANAFNTPVPTNPTVASQSATWVAKTFTTANVQWSSVAVQSEDGWPVYYAKASDPTITVHSSAGQTVTFQCPTSAVPSSDSDGHLIVIQPDGNTEVEMWQAHVTSTSPLAISCSNVSGNFKVGLTSNVLTNETGNSARGCGLSCLAGLIMQDEFDYALKNGTAIPHALAVSMPYNAPTFVEPAIDSDGGAQGGTPMGTWWWLPRAVDISGLPPAVQVIARTLQKYGAFNTDSEGGAIGFQGQMISGTDAAYLSLDQPDGTGSKTPLAGLPWASMQFLAS